MMHHRRGTWVTAPLGPSRFATWSVPWPSPPVSGAGLARGREEMGTLLVVGRASPSPTRPTCRPPLWRRCMAWPQTCELAWLAFYKPLLPYSAE